MGAWLGRYQAWLFFPMLLLEAVHLHIAGMRALLGRSGKARWAEAGLLTVHIGGYLTAVFVVLSPVQAVVFLVVQQGLFGVYLGSSFAPNHKACLLWARMRGSISCAATSSPRVTSTATG